jgi:UPF0755 protein
MRWVMAAIFVLMAACGAGWLAFERLLAPVSASDRASLVEVRPGSGVAAIARQLEKQRLIRSDAAFTLYLRLKGYDRGIKAGLYAIAPKLGARGVAEVLVEGRGMGTRVTVPEGLALRDIATLFGKKVPGGGERFLAYASRPSAFREDFAWLPPMPAGATLEGFCFPDTYVVTPGPGAAADLLRLMLARFEQAALPTLRRPGSSLDLYQRLVLASIVEKEAVHAAERPMIAGVFYNRLAQGMPFGSDPTVEYALGRHQDARGLTFKDIAVDSPYNTYKHAGLPPGPIANPGLASIQAAVAPAKTPLLYFVARGDGSHVFTKTYAEHLAAQARIIAGRR